LTNKPVSTTPAKEKESAPLLHLIKTNKSNFYATNSITAQSEASIP
jgi:hypothetical protein